MAIVSPGRLEDQGDERLPHLLKPKAPTARLQASRTRFDILMIDLRTLAYEPCGSPTGDQIQDDALLTPAIRAELGAKGFEARELLAYVHTLVAQRTDSA